MKNDWKNEASNIIRAEKARNGLQWDTIADRYKKRFDRPISGRSLASKISAGTFSFAFALQLLSVIGTANIDIPKK